MLAGAASKVALQYLHDTATYSGGQVLWLNRARLDHLGTELEQQFGTAAALLAAMAATVWATTLQVIPCVPAKQHASTANVSLTDQILFTWSHVRFYGSVLVLLYWGFSLAFSIINELVLIGADFIKRVRSPHVPYWTPFVQPDPLMVLSLATFAVYTCLRLRPRAWLRQSGPQKLPV